MKKIQRINESQLRAIVAESVKRALRDGFGPDVIDIADVCVCIPLDDEDNIDLGEEKIRTILEKLKKTEHIGSFEKEDNAYIVDIIGEDDYGNIVSYSSAKQHTIGLLAANGIYAEEL